MECLDAQRAISDALDRLPVDAAVVEAAKDHCRSCSECAAFVRALTVVKRAPLPQPPADLADRVMATIRAEAAANEAAARAAAAAAAASDAAAETIASDTDGLASAPGAAPGDAARPPARAAWKYSPATLAWSAAALFFVLAVALVTANGLRSMPSGSSQAAAPSTAETKATVAPPAADQLTAPNQDAQSAGSATTASSTPGPEYITLTGAVYKFVGIDTSTTTNGLTTFGQTSNSLKGSSVQPYSVLRGADSTRVYIQVDPQTLLAFERVTRTYQGHTYGLVSKEISRYGTWATLPPSFQVPTAPDGSPTFAALAQDTSGAMLYRLATDTSGSGIAVAPGSPSTDPAAGNPNWTWWLRLQ